MNTIDINNYESYALDFLEDNLSSADKHAFEVFLSQHPEVRQEIDAMNMESIPVPSVSYPHKNKLYRTNHNTRIFSFIGSMAAGLALLLLFRVYLPDQDNTAPRADVAIHKESSKSVTKKALVEAVIPSTHDTVPSTSHIEVAQNGSYTSHPVVPKTTRKNNKRTAPTEEVPITPVHDESELALNIQDETQNITENEDTALDALPTRKSTQRILVTTDLPLAISSAHIKEPKIIQLSLDQFDIVSYTDARPEDSQDYRREVSNLLPEVLQKYDVAISDETKKNSFFSKLKPEVF